MHCNLLLVRASQEKLVTNASVMCSKSNELNTVYTRPEAVKSTDQDKAVISTSTSLTLEKETITLAQQNDVLLSVFPKSVGTKCSGLSSSNKKAENVNLTNSTDTVPTALNVQSSKAAAFTTESTALMITSNPLNSSACAPDEIERKRLEALKRRQNKLRLTRKCSKVTL